MLNLSVEFTILILYFLVLGWVSSLLNFIFCSFSRAGHVSGTSSSQSPIASLSTVVSCWVFAGFHSYHLVLCLDFFCYVSEIVICSVVLEIIGWYLLLERMLGLLLPGPGTHKDAGVILIWIWWQLFEAELQLLTQPWGTSLWVVTWRGGTSRLLSPWLWRLVQVPFSWPSRIVMTLPGQKRPKHLCLPPAFISFAFKAHFQYFVQVFLIVLSSWPQWHIPALLRMDVQPSFLW